MPRHIETIRKGLIALLVVIIGYPVICLLMSPIAADADAITIDATSTKQLSTAFAGNFVSSTSFTVSAACTNPVLYMISDIFQDVAGTGKTATATWNGVAMSNVVTTTRSSNIAADVWRLKNPASGAHTLAASISGNTDAVVMQIWSLCGVNQTNPEYASSTPLATGTGINASTTPGTTTDFLFDSVSLFGGTSPVVGATGQVKTLATTTANSLNGWGSYVFGTSTALTSMKWTWTGANNGVEIMMDIAPASSTVVPAPPIHSVLLGNSVFLGNNACIFQ